MSRKTEEQQERIRTLEKDLSKHELACRIVELEGQVITDPLTGVFSKAYLTGEAETIFNHMLVSPSGERRKERQNKRNNSKSLLFLWTLITLKKLMIHKGTM